MSSRTAFVEQNSADGNLLREIRQRSRATSASNISSDPQNEKVCSSCYNIMFARIWL